MPTAPDPTEPSGIVARGSRRLDPRRVRRALALLAVVVGIYGGMVVALAYAFLHPLRFGVGQGPNSIGLRYEDVTFSSATDGRKLHGWYIPADAPKPRGLIVFCHGRQGNRATVLTHASYLHKAGYSLLSFDFRACGDSEGSMSTIGYREVGDAVGALRYVGSRADTRQAPLGIFGVSMGAAVAIQTAARCPELRCVIADSSFATLDSAVRQRFDGLLGPAAFTLCVPVERVGEQMMGIAALSVSPLAAVPRISPRPILFIHGDQDQLCPVGDSRLMFAAAAPGTAQLWVVHGAGHVGAYHAEPKEYRHRVLAFLQKSLPGR